MNLIIKRPTWKIKSIPYRPRTNSLRRLYGKISPWLALGVFLLFLALGCVLIGE